ncbi:MAG: YbaN family protein [Phenylobacterium sp.]|uniref:YbaN family protein n=1 Tax=Phenylobacterium sp. TaxID=1871053 RepID=UPI00391C6848
MKRWLFLVLGLVLTGLGIVGAFVPLMPTTIFLILAAACFTHSSPRLEAWLLDHARFGPTLRAWRENGAIPPRAKALACAGMAFGFLVFFAVVHPGLPLALGVGAALAACAAFVLSRPSGPAAS